MCQRISVSFRLFRTRAAGITGTDLGRGPPIRQRFAADSAVFSPLQITIKVGVLFRMAFRAYDWGSLATIVDRQMDSKCRVLAPQFRFKGIVKSDFENGRVCVASGHVHGRQ